MKTVLTIAFLSLFTLTIFAQSIIADGATVKKLDGTMSFTEGPIADASGDVYFTDIPPSNIMKWSEEKGLSVFMEAVPGCNGLFFDPDSNLVVCGHAGARNVWLINLKNRETDIIVSKRDGIQYNSPNDLWIDKKGGIYFTDPKYGQRDETAPELGYEYVYYILPGKKKANAVITDFVKPNGIIGTPDGKLLYVADIGDEKVYKYTIGNNGTLTDKTLFARERCDGMTMDEKGNLYFTSTNVRVYSPDGEKITEIDIPERPANVCFGGKERKTLYITARKGFYAIEMNVRGAY